MRALRAFLLIPFLLFLPLSASSQPALQKADLGRCMLENGAVLQNCHIGYRTAGTLNPNRSNAVLFPTWFSGTSGDLVGQLGPEGLVDTTRYFVVLVDALGNGVSSSPSTSTAQPDSTFPVFSIRDMVDTQHRLLTESLAIDSLHAVVGASMGGMQALEWIARYPAFMDKVVSITGTPRLTAQDRLLWRAELRAFRATDPDGQRAAMKAVSAIHGLHLHTPQYLAGIDSTAFHNFVAERDAHILAFNPYDWAWQIKAMLRHDVTEPFGGSLSWAAAAVKADALVVTITQDHMVNPLPARRFARELGAQQLALDTPCGHLGTGCKQDTVQATVSRFLHSEK